MEKLLKGTAFFISLSPMGHAEDRVQGRQVYISPFLLPQDDLMVLSKIHVTDHIHL